MPLPPGTGDAGWLRAFHAVVPALLREFDPQVLVTQHGCDSHVEDPLAHLMLTVDGQRATYLALHDLAHEVCEGRWVVTGGGGYALVEVVPRAWTHLLAIVGGSPLDPLTETPDSWRAHVKTSLGRVAPFRLTDGRTPAYRDWSQGYDPDTWLDRAIHATRTRRLPAARSRSAALICANTGGRRFEGGKSRSKATRHAVVTRMTLVIPFPMSHRKPYSH